MPKTSKKILLVITPPSGGHKEHLPAPGVGYVASYLEKNNYNVKILDVFIYGYGNQQVIKRALEEKPDAVGIVCVSNNRFDAIKIINGIRENNKEVLIFGGGRHFHNTSINSLEKIKGLDVIVCGEGEITTLEMLNAYFDGKGFKNISGLVYKEGDQIIINEKRNFIKNLDEIPWPAWHLFDLDKYTAQLEGYKRIKSIGVISSRGCPSRCTFCANNSFWPFLRRRSPKDFVDEVEFLHKKYGYKGFDFWDDTITIVRNHIKEICEEIIKRKLDIIWYARARVNTVDEELLKLMKRAGCRVIGFGVESGSDRILNIIKKNISTDQAKKAVYLCAKLGIITKVFMIHGLPGETEEDVIKTKKIIVKLKSYGAKYKTQIFASLGSVPILYPGTEMTRDAENEGIISKNFDWCEPVYFEKNAKFGMDPYMPLYENKKFPIDKIMEIEKKFDRKIINILKYLWYNYRIMGTENFFKKILTKTVKNYSIKK